MNQLVTVLCVTLSCMWLCAAVAPLPAVLLQRSSEAVSGAINYCNGWCISTLNSGSSTGTALDLPLGAEYIIGD